MSIFFKLHKVMREKRVRAQQEYAFELLEQRNLLAASAIISEFLASNQDVLIDRDGDSSDWIELLNAGDQSIDLEGWYLTDDAQNFEKWPLPSVQLRPNQTKIVFASGKDRSRDIGELHTNFKLTSDGEYLALVEPDGTTIASEFTPNFPPQVEDVSYGIPTESMRTTLVSHGAPTRVFIPTDASVDPISNDTIAGSWLDPSFDDQSNGWFAAATGIGFEVADNPEIVLADSQDDWSFTGTQGENGWRFGYYNQSADGDGTYDASEFRTFPDHYFTGIVWDWPSGNPPDTLIGIQNTNPNGLNSGDEHWAIRRYESEAAGVLSIDWLIRKNNLARGGNGVSGRIFHNGSEVDQVFLDGTDNVGANRTVSISGVQVGDLIDFVIDPKGADGVSDDTMDNVRFTATIQAISGIGSNIHAAGDIENQMHDVGSSAYMRIPFEIESPDELNSLELNIRYDDAFVAYLNGLPVASSSGVEAGDVAFDSTSLISRDTAQANNVETFDISDDLEFIRSGTNILAIHGLNVSDGDDDFLVQPELIATALQIDTDAHRYFVNPTPGELNGIGATDVGPLFLSHQFTFSSINERSMPLRDDTIIVTANVAESFHAIDEVTLRYRVMYGTERTLKMKDDGIGNDATAGDGMFTATIPARIAQPGQMVRWYLTAIDTTQQASRLPEFQRPLDSDEYFGTVIYDASVESSNLPIFYWFARNPSRANTNSGTRSSLYFDGEFYDNILFDIHGQSTRGSAFPKKSYDVDFNRGNRFRWNDTVGRMKDINLLTNYADKGKFRNMFAYDVWNLAGDGRSHLAEPVRIQQNGDFFGVYDFVEDGDDRFLKRIGLDPEGALYKAYNSIDSASGNQKITRKHEDFSDLQALIDGAKRTGQARKEFLFDNVDLPGTVNFLAAMVVNANIDCCHKNYYVYRDTNRTGEWTFLPWDADLSFGRLWTRSKNYFDDIIKIDTGVPYGYNSVTRSLLQVSEFREMYFRRVKTLIDRYLQAPDTPQDELYFERRLDEFVQLLDPHDDNPANGFDDADLDFQKWGTWGNNYTLRDEIESVKTIFLPQRREFIYNTQTVGNGGEIPGESSFLFQVLVAEDAPVSALVPRGPIDDSWRDVSFDDSSWLHGTSGVGYERSNGYQEFLGIDLLSGDIPSSQRIDRDGNGTNDNNSVLTRFEFSLNDIADFENLTLQLRIDDGFVAYLNGTEVARRNFSGTPNWNSTANGNGAEASAAFSSFDITTHIGSLREDENVLAIHGLNQGTRSSDMVIQPRLLAGVESDGLTSIEFGSLDFNPVGGNQDAEYVELVNPSPDAIDISGWSLRGGIEHEFAAGTVVPSNDSIYVTPDVVAFRARAEGPSGGQGLFVQGGYQGHLSNFGESLSLHRDDGSFVVDLTYEGLPTDLQEYLRFSELMYHPLRPSASELSQNPSLKGHDFEFVELINTSSSQSLDLSGVRITSGIEFDFENSRVTNLDPGQRVLVVSNESAFAIRYGNALSSKIAGQFENFSRLDNGGEQIKMEDGTGSTIVDFGYGDRDELWPLRADGRGSSLQIVDASINPAIAANWQPSTLIHGSPGSTDMVGMNDIVINEILSHTDLPELDSIELFNRSDRAISTDLFFLSDSSQTVDALSKYSLASKSIAANGYLVLDESDFNSSQGGSPHDFALDGAHGDEVYLTSGMGTPSYFVDFVSFGAVANGETYGRLPNGTGSLAPLKSNTLGFANSSARVGPLIISEVQYNPGPASDAALQIEPELDSNDLEFIELVNHSPRQIDLTNWRIRKGVDFDFSQGTTIDAGANLVVLPFDPTKVENEGKFAAFRAHYNLGEGVTFVGGYSGQLSNSGEIIQLQRPDEPPIDEPQFIPRLLEDELHYDDITPWPILADGTGNSLQRIHLNAYGNDSTSWVAADPSPGFTEAIVEGDFNQDGQVDAQDIDLLTAAISANDEGFDLTSDGIIDQSDLTYLVQEILQTNYGDSNLDGRFNSLDLIQIFQIGEYEDEIIANSTWADGDWNGDREFNSGDLITAFQFGGYTANVLPNQVVLAATLDRNPQSPEWKPQKRRVATPVPSMQTRAVELFFAETNSDENLEVELSDETEDFAPSMQKYLADGLLEGKE